jgi:hypothetical protein
MKAQLIQVCLQEIMDWFCAIRMAKIKLLQETFPERPLEIVNLRHLCLFFKKYCMYKCNAD